MFLAIEKLRELIKTYTTAQTVALATESKTDFDYAVGLLNQINALRLELAVNAEMCEIFWGQIDVTNAANVNTVQNVWFSKNDKAWIFKRAIAALDSNVQVAMMNQGLRQRTITRESVPWQQLFPTVQSVALGQQTLFDLPESLRFGENQSLNLAIQGQITGFGDPAQGYIFPQGCTLKDNLEDSTVKELQAEFIDREGNTIYLPETQIVPLIFQFPTNAVGVFATDPNGSDKIFTIKSEKSVLLTGISTSVPFCRIDKLTDEGKNQTLVERVEMQGVASNMTNSFTTYYDLPYPHVLRRGDRLKGVFQNGSILSDEVTAANVLSYVAFEGITL